MKTTLYLLGILIGFLFPLKVSGTLPGSISGKVMEEVDGLPIPSAVVSLYFGDDTTPPIGTIPTDENGFFKFQALKPGTYHIKVSYIGFVPFFSRNIMITEKDPDKDLGVLKLSSDQQSLAEVNITAEKPTVEFGADMITYNVSQSLLAEGSTATDLLKNVPMVQVDIDGNATIPGKRSTRIFIDGKPSDYMSSNIADLLNVLPSDAIEKIEVMTNPPAKYSADGEGIINIVLKKGFKVGFNGNAGLTAGMQGNTNANTNAAYRARKFAVNASAAFRQNTSRRTNESFRENFFPDTTFYYDQHTANRSKNKGGNFRTGLDWDISKQQNLRVSANLNYNNSKGSSGNTFNYLDHTKTLSRIRDQQNLNEGKSNNVVFNADYEVKLDSSGQKLTAGLTLNSNSGSNFRLMDRKFIFPDIANPTLQENDNHTGSKGVNFNLDYDKPMFKKRDRIEMGLRYHYRENDNDLLVQNFDFKEQLYLVNETLTNRFLYKEHILSGYASYNYRKNGWGIKGGLRTEMTKVNFDLSTGNKYPLDPYISLFPNISFNRFFKKKYNLGATYSIRINRPRENTLNPQVNDNDPLNISFGNPDLQPAYTHQMDLSFGMFQEKWSFTPRLSYSTSKGVIERFRTVSSNGVSETTYDNVGSNDALALILIGNYRPTKKISTHANFHVIQSKYASILNNSLNRDGISVRAAMGFSMQLPLRAAFETNLNYENNVNAQGRTSGSVNTSLAARKLFFKNKLNVRISGNDPFGKRNNTLFNEGNNFKVDSYSTNNSSNFTVSVNYRITKVNKAAR
ncbi:outer membrane beta-barrel protein [Pedobacter immunditicola]|uniref:outer membrane beta-barrel protein n=1 Tax=Pedobacter immunditicola TaxID=3133440 RepID=UPI0030B3A1BB